VSPRPPDAPEDPDAPDDPETPENPEAPGDPETARPRRAAATTATAATATTQAELISFPGRRGNAGARPEADAAAGARAATAHLSANRSLIVRRALLASAVGGIVPLPVMDDYLAGRVRAGMLMQLADRRRVDLAPSSAELLADPREGTAARNATMTAATLLAFKLAWRKFFVLLAAGRRAEEMATTFQVGTLFDHFCAKLHVGAGPDRETANQLRRAMFASIRDSESAALVEIFRDGGRQLGRSIGEAPAWFTQRLQKVVEQFVASGGNPDAVVRDADDAGAADPGEARWLDRAAARVEDGLGRLGHGYLAALLGRFDDRWATVHAHDKRDGDKHDGDKRGGGPPGTETNL
jgi:hypothetical protein